MSTHPSLLLSNKLIFCTQIFFIYIVYVLFIYIVFVFDLRKLEIRNSNLESSSACYIHWLTQSYYTLLSYPIGSGYKNNIGYIDSAENVCKKIRLPLE